jgi:hypothetical protein
MEDAGQIVLPILQGGCMAYIDSLSTEEYIVSSFSHSLCYSFVFKYPGTDQQRLQSTSSPTAARPSNKRDSSRYALKYRRFFAFDIGSFIKRNVKIKEHSVQIHTIHLSVTIHRGLSPSPHRL